MREYVEQKLSADWLPWKWQINIIDDGEAYGSKGRIRVAMHNFESHEEARSFIKRQALSRLVA